MERDLLVTKAREFAVEEGRRFEARPRARSREILALEAEYPAVQVELPSPVFKVFNRVAAVFGGGGLRPEQAASGPPATFVVLAIILALFFQRILGVR